MNYIKKPPPPQKNAIGTSTVHGFLCHHLKFGPNWSRSLEVICKYIKTALLPNNSPSKVISLGHPLGFPLSPHQIWSKSVKGSWSIMQIYKNCPPRPITPLSKNIIRTSAVHGFRCHQYKFGSNRSRMLEVISKYIKTAFLPNTGPLERYVIGTSAGGSFIPTPNLVKIGQGILE